MIMGMGTDIVENHRIREVYEKHGRRFLKRIFSDEEIEYSLSHEAPVPYLSARFAVKEAFVKALSLPGGAGLNWRDVEVSGKIFGKKQLVLHNKAKAIAEEKGANKFHISLSHSRTQSLAVVILEKI